MCLAAMTLTRAQTTPTAIESEINRDGWFNHLDFAVTAGTLGFGFDVSSPMTKWARLRVGAEFRPLKHYNPTFGMEVAENLSKQISSDRFDKLATMMSEFTGYKPANKIKMEGDLGINQFKFLVDIFPFKNNRHWHFTAGFYYGSSNTLIEAKNTAESMNTLTAVTIYNTMYRRALANKNPISTSSLDASGIKMDSYIDKLRRWGSNSNDANGNATITSKKVDYSYEYEDNGHIYTASSSFEVKQGSFSDYGISIPLGKYKHDVIATEDIYYDYSEKLYVEGPTSADVSEFMNMRDANGNPIDVSSDEYHYQKDANGRYIKEGSIRYKKGEVIHKEGDDFRMVPDEENIVKATAKARKFKPYIGFGYETTLSKDDRLSIAVDAGIMFWGGHPSIDVRTPVGVNAEGETIYMTYDLSRDITGMPSSVNSYVNTIKKYSVLPQANLRIAYRIF